jgi:hypothetical protein
MKRYKRLVVLNSKQDLNQIYPSKPKNARKKAERIFSEEEQPFSGVARKRENVNV